MIFEDMNLMKLVRPGKRAKANPKVEKAIADLQANGQKVTLKKISELSGVAYMTLYMSGKYAQYVNKHKKVAPAVEEKLIPKVLENKQDKKTFCILVEQTNEIHHVHGAEELFPKIKELLLKDSDYVLEIYRLSATARVEITIIDVN